MKGQKPTLPELPSGETIDITGWKSLKLKRGDIILMHSPEQLKGVTLQRVSRSMERLSLETGCRFVLMPHDWKASVLRPEQIEDGE